MVQVPAVSIEAMMPETEQTVGVVELKATGRPEVELAIRRTAVSTIVVGMAGKLMVCGACETEKLCKTMGAALYVLLPVCEAWMVQDPATRKEAVVPETVQTAGVSELKPTARPEVEVAERPRLVSAIWVGMAGKVMVCATAGRGGEPMNMPKGNGPTVLPPPKLN